MSDYPERFPPDAPVVPNDAWRDLAPVDPPPYCGRLGKLTHRRHRFYRPEPFLARQTCIRCDAVRYTVPSAKW